MEREIMRYSKEGKTELLYSAKDKDGYGLAIVNTRGTHPCAYITFPGIEKLESYDDFSINDPEEFEGIYTDCGVHGGFTFLGTLSHLGLEGIWIGWDYSHLGDYNPFLPKTDEHKYTSEQVAKDALLALTLVKTGHGEIYED